MTESEKQQFNIYLPGSLVRRIKHAAVDEGESLSALVERVLEAYLQENAQEHGGEENR